MPSSEILAGIFRRDEGLIRHFPLGFSTMWFRDSYIYGATFILVSSLATIASGVSYYRNVG
jgi:hypothetical protein